MAMRTIPLWTALAVATACGSQDALGELLQDAGRALSDSGEAQADAAGGGGLTVLEAPCDDVYAGSVASSVGGSEMTRYYADIGIGDSDIVSAYACDYAPDEACPDGATCEWDRPPPPSGCSPAALTVADGKAYVYCGQDTRVAGGANIIGHFTRARVVTRP